MIPLWIIGSGGHAAVVIDAARASGIFDVVGCLDDDRSRIDEQVLGAPVRGDTSAADLRRLGVEVAVVAIGSNVARRRISQRLDEMIDWATIIHPRACVGQDVQIGHGTVVMAGAVVQARTRIGPHGIINTAATVDHDGQIGAFTHIGPGSHLAGNVSIGAGVQLGVACSAIPGVTVGEWSVVGAGAVVIRDLPPHATAVGIPARVIGRRAI